MLCSFTYSSLKMFILFISSQIILPSVFAQNETTCISNYAEVKQALLQEGTGNMERLLYAFTPPNLPLPHFIWVYYFHNQSSEWSDILTCPPSGLLQRCPLLDDDDNIDQGNSNSTNEDDSQYHIIFWADSPMLINVDIPLLKLLSYNSILQYLGNESCVQLVIPPFCASVDPASERKMLNFATSYLRSYSYSGQESYRDYVLHCEEKFDIEYAYDGFLLCSEIIVCVGSALLFVFLSFILCTIERKEPKGKTSKSGNSVANEGIGGETKRGEDRLCKNEEEEQIQMEEIKTEKSGSDAKGDSEEETGDTKKKRGRRLFQLCKNVKCSYSVKADVTFDKHKVYLSVVLIVNVAAISFLFADAVQFHYSREILEEAFWYGYGGFSVILFITAFVAVLIEIPVFTIYLTVFCIVKYFTEKDFCFRRTHDQHKECLFYTLVLSTILTLISFIYVLSRGFLVALAFASYPLEVGFILLAIGSGFVALFFVIWAAVHIGVESSAKKVKSKISTIVSLVPYGSLLIILTGFLLSYIFVILRLNIRVGDPVTSLVAALIPTAVGFVAANRYKSGLKKIKDGKSGNQTNATDSE